MSSGQPNRKGPPRGGVGSTRTFYRIYEQMRDCTLNQVSGIGFYQLLNPRRLPFGYTSMHCSCSDFFVESCVGIYIEGFFLPSPFQVIACQEDCHRTFSNWDSATRI